MNQDQIDICLAFARLRLLPGTFNKRFTQTLFYHAKNNPEQPITEKQNEWMFKMLYTYRKQLPVMYEKHKNNPLCAKPTKSK